MPINRLRVQIEEATAEMNAAVGTDRYTEAHAVVHELTSRKIITADCGGTVRSVTRTEYHYSAVVRGEHPDDKTVQDIHYGSLREVYVKTGDSVQAGAPIGWRY